MTVTMTPTTFGRLKLGDLFHWPGFPETLLVKVSPRNYVQEREGFAGGKWGVPTVTKVVKVVTSDTVA